MSKSVKVTLGIIAGFLLLCCGGGAVLVFSGVQAYQGISKTVVPTGDKVVATVCQDWDYKTLLPLSSQEVTSTSEAEMKALFGVWKSEYGAYKSGTGTMTGFHTRTSTGSGRVDTATYVNEAQFANGPAVITIGLIKEGSNAWKVRAFRVSKP
ncbi:MAG: hypothetical protein JNM34_09250 [Chthonomonadaceae bacterium]|nr:hypothetical protein [Chthonomonadaceae bacterium]